MSIVHQALHQLNCTVTYQQLLHFTLQIVFKHAIHYKYIIELINVYL